jgi:hypothetical protein
MGQDNAFRMPGVVQTISGMLQEFETWKRITDTPDESGHVSVAYEVRYLYIGPDGIRRGIDKSDLGLSEGIDAGPSAGPMPGTYEIHIVDASGNDLIEPFRAEHVTYDSMATRRSPQESLAGVYGTALQDAEATIRNQRSRLNDSERREQRARDDLNLKQDQLTKALSDVANYRLAAERATAEAAADRERCAAFEAELEQLRADTAMFKPHVGMIVDEGMRRLCGVLGFPMPNTEQSNDEQGDPMPQGIGCEDPMGTLDAYLKLTLLNPYMARYLIRNSKILTPPGVMNWKLVRAVVWLFYKRDLGAVPNWDAMCADWDAMIQEIRAEDGNEEDEEPAAAE